MTLGLNCIYDLGMHVAFYLLKISTVTIYNFKKPSEYEKYLKISSLGVYVVVSILR